MVFRWNILNNDVLDTAGHAETLATDNTLGSYSDNRLVGSELGKVRVLLPERGRELEL